MSASGEVLEDKNSGFKMENEETKIASKYGIRHLEIFLLFLLLSITFSNRVNLSVAIVAMVDDTENIQFKQYDWDTSIQSIVLSSFFWGYITSQLPAGPLSQKYGAKILLLISCVMSSLLTLLTPWFASFGGWKMVCAIRVLIGLSQGFVYACTNTLLTKWVPPTERSSLSAIVYAGAQFGTVVMLAVGGLLAASVGWPSIFYSSGGSGLIWSVCWWFYGAESPSDYKNISKAEKEYIENSNTDSLDRNSHSLTVPWIAIFKNVPFLSLIFVHCSNNWGFWTLLTNIPTYMKNVLDFDIKSNGLLSALPYFVMWILGVFFGFLSDFLIKRKYITQTAGRKIFNSIAFWNAMIMLIGLGYVTKEEKEIGVLLLTLGVGVSSAAYAGFMINHMDLSPNYAGTLMGVTNCVSNIISIIAPLVVGIIVTDEKDQTEWKVVFFISAGIYFIGNLIFILFGKAMIQPFNDA